MADTYEDAPELLFFDTFSHEVNDDLNLDLVQFPKPVYVTEVRIIPLGARVQADFPGGVRLGATNPSKFHIEFFVNDLGKPGASTFESLGNFEYNQNDCIHLNCDIKDVRQIPTDGLVLRGWYTTITLAVYGTFTKGITEQIPVPVPQPPPPVVVQPQPISIAVNVPVLIPTATTIDKTSIDIPVANWPQPIADEIAPIAVAVQPHEEYAAATATAAVVVAPVYVEEYEAQPSYGVQPPTYYEPGESLKKESVRQVPAQPPLPPPAREIRRRERSGSSESDWDRDEQEELAAAAVAAIARKRELEQRSPDRLASHRASSREISSRNYSRSSSRERDYYARDRKRDWSSRSPDYRHSRHSRSYDRKRDKSRDRRSPTDKDSHECAKRPRTPPSISPTRRPPRTPPKPAPSPCESLDDTFKGTGGSISSSKADYSHDGSKGTTAKYHEKGQPIRVIDHSIDDRAPIVDKLCGNATEPPSPAPTVVDSQAESPSCIDDDAMSQGEPFEPILSDEEIGDEPEPPFDLDYDDGEFDDIMKSFVPGTSLLESVDPLPNTAADTDGGRELDAVLRFLQRIKMRGDPLTAATFMALSADAKEQWVHTSEHFIQMLLPVHNLKFMRRNQVLRHIIDEYMDLLAAWVRLGLAFDCALQQPQPGYKIRHIKIGARMTELLCCDKTLMEKLLYRQAFDVFSELLLLYEQKYMALSIKLMLIKAIYSCLDTKVGVDHFLKEISGANGVGCQTTGYQQTLVALQLDPLTRVKFALKSLLRKVTLYESLQLIRETVTNMYVNDSYNSEENLTTDVQLLEITLKDVWKAYTVGSYSCTQPKRFLPVSAKFELAKDGTAQKSTECTFIAYFIETALVHSIFVLLAHERQLSESLMHVCFAMLSALAATTSGLDLLMYNVDTVNMLVKCLLNSDLVGSCTGVDEEKMVTDADELVPNGEEQRGINLGLEIAYKIKTKYCLDVIANTKDDAEVITDMLHTLYSLTANQMARIHIANTITMDNNITILTNLIEKEKLLEVPRPNSPSALQKCKSAIIGYAIDLIEITIRYSLNLAYLEEHSTTLCDLVKSIDIYDSSIAVVIQEIAIYLKPLEISNVFSYDNISPLCELLKRSIDYITTFPGDLITVLRLIRHLASPQFDDDDNALEHVELKHKFVVLQLYSLDGITMLTLILDKMTGHFDQPTMHAAALATMPGYLMTQILRPTIELLRKMITYVIQSLNTQYTDLLAIDSLLKTYNLMQHITDKCPAYADAQYIQTEIVRTLLAYTQPTPVDGVDTESVHKSLWTQMIGECLKYTLIGPYTYASGLMAFSELLPAPLPIWTNEKLSDTETVRLKTERQLWSAHLHPKSAQLSEIIQTMCVTSDPRLLSALACACVQLADLAPNMSLLVAKTLCDSLLQVGCEALPTLSAAGQQRRILYFLSTLLMHAQIKVSILSILPGKLIEFLIGEINSTTGDNEDVQDFVMEIFELLLDARISIVPVNCPVEHTAYWYHSALPGRDVLTMIGNAVVDVFLQMDARISLRCLAVRLLMCFTAVDCTFYVLRSVLDKKKEQLAAVIEQFHTVSECSDIMPLLNSFIDFIVHLIANPSNTSPARTLVLSPIDTATMLNWTPVDKPHPLKDLFNILEMIDDSGIDVNREKLSSFIDQMDASLARSPAEWLEPAYPMTNEGLVALYNARPIYVMSDDYKCYQWSNTYFWEQFSGTKVMAADDHVVVDLAELIKTCLPAEMNIVSECKRLLHLSASPQSNRERTTTAPCFRTRRVEVEPTTGRPEKKIYVTRGRGFPRTPPTRGDLFRSRPPNTSRPPSLHVDDFLALETCGAQPTGPTGYNKLARDMIGIRGTRGGRGRGYGNERGRISSSGQAGGGYRQANRRTNSPSTWQNHGAIDGTNASSQHYRTATSEPVVSSHFQGDYQQQHFSGPQQRGRLRGGPRTQRLFNR